MSEEEKEEITITYEPLGTEAFGPMEMFSQGAAALDLAAVLALESGDVDGLVKVAKGWTKLASAVAGIEELPEENKKIQRFGFSKESAEEEENGKTDSKSNGKDDSPNQRGLRSYRIRSN